MQLKVELMALEADAERAESASRLPGLERSVRCKEDGARSQASLDTGARLVGPFELDRVAAPACAFFHAADVADFAMAIVVPTLPRTGIGDRSQSSCESSM